MPPIHRRYRWWRGMLKGAVAGTSPTGPWTDGQTGAQTPNDNECHPCLLCYLTQKWFKRELTNAAPPTERADGPLCVCVCIQRGGISYYGGLDGLGSPY